MYEPCVDRSFAVARAAAAKHRRADTVGSPSRVHHHCIAQRPPAAHMFGGSMSGLDLRVLSGLLTVFFPRGGPGGSSVLPDWAQSPPPDKPPLSIWLPELQTLGVDTSDLRVSSS